jgi:hypothetical protein
MNSLQRFAWILLGLMVLLGVAHAPLHADADRWGEECGQLALCSGAVVLLFTAVAPLFQRFFTPLRLRVMVELRAPFSLAQSVYGSRGPPVH